MTANPWLVRDAIGVVLKVTGLVNRTDPLIMAVGAELLLTVRLPLGR